MRPTIAITSGEPAGIGPDLCLQLLSRPTEARLGVLGNSDILQERARMLGIKVSFVNYPAGDTLPPNTLEIINIPLSRTCHPGKLDPVTEPHVLAMLDRAVDGCMAGEFAAMVTMPVHKGVINDAGIAFTGHTEYLAERTGTARVVMMLAGGGLRVALATTHLALKDVPAAITQDDLAATLRILDHDLRSRFGINNPRILVAGLNPHAGEGGHLGGEEIDVITPVLDQLRHQGLTLIGPLPADTLFTPKQLERGDAVLAMYHDQGLPVLKFASFGRGVNITLGLPIVRTSVDHGTALELAGMGGADTGSLFEAIDTAIAIAMTHS